MPLHWLRWGKGTEGWQSPKHCLPSAGTSTLSTRASSHFCRDAGSPEPSNLSGRARWLYAGSSAPHFQLLPAPSHPMQGQQKTWNGGLTRTLCSRQFTGLMLGGYLLLRRPSLLSAGMESEVVRERGRRSGVLPTWPSLGLWPRKWGKGERERSSSSWDPREPELSCKKLQLRYTMSCQTPGLLLN